VLKQHQQLASRRAQSIHRKFVSDRSLGGTYVVMITSVHSLAAAVTCPGRLCPVSSVTQTLVMLLIAVPSRNQSQRFTENRTCACCACADFDRSSVCTGVSARNKSHPPLNAGQISIFGLSKQLLEGRLKISTRDATGDRFVCANWGSRVCDVPPGDITIVRRAWGKTGHV
jgi:hypothetical protein